MTHDFQMKRGRTAEIRFKSQSLFLLVPAAQQPVNGQRARTKLHSDVGVFKAPRRKLKAGMQTGTGKPLRVENASLASAGGLYPAQRFGASAAVVRGEKEVPEPQSGDRSDNVNHKKAPHNASSDADGTSEVAAGARGQWTPRAIFLQSSTGGLWKTHTASGMLGCWRFRRPLPAPVYNGRVPFAIRDAKPEDFETLWRMDQECFAAGIAYSREELKVYMRRRGAFTLLAAGEDGTVAGFIVVHGGPTGHVITIDVIEAARRSGVGSQLLRAAEERLRATGSRVVGLETAVDNLAGLSFYKRHGYSVVRTWPRYYSNGVDALVLKKELTIQQK